MSNRFERAGMGLAALFCAVYGPVSVWGAGAVLHYAGGPALAFAVAAGGAALARRQGERARREQDEQASRSALSERLLQEQQERAVRALAQLRAASRGTLGLSVGEAVAHHTRTTPVPRATGGRIVELCSRCHCEPGMFAHCYYCGEPRPPRPDPFPAPGPRWWQ